MKINFGAYAIKWTKSNGLADKNSLNWGGNSKKNIVTAPVQACFPLYLIYSLCSLSYTPLPQ